jgi:hypothetical protein
VTTTNLRRSVGVGHCDHHQLSTSSMFLFNPLDINCGVGVRSGMNRELRGYWQFRAGQVCLGVFRFVLISLM